MRLPQVLVCEHDGQLARLLRAAPRLGLILKTADNPVGTWSLREARRVDTCVRILTRGGPSVLVLRMGHDLVREFTLLERIGWLFPDTAVVVVGDPPPDLARLARDFGTAVVLASAQQSERLPEIVAAQMNAALLTLQRALGKESAEEVVDIVAEE